MRWRSWKRLLVGWVLVGMFLSTPAVAQYCYYGACSSGGDDDGLRIKPWMILAYICYYAFLAGGLEGCTPEREPGVGFP